MARAPKTWAGCLAIGAIGTVGAAVAACTITGGGGGDGSGGETPDGDPVFLGSCTGAPDEQGVYSCLEYWQAYVDGPDPAIPWQAGCVNAGGSYSSGHCAGGYVGCCVRTQEEPDYMSERLCYYGPGDWSLAEPTCTGLGGVWD